VPQLFLSRLLFPHAGFTYALVPLLHYGGADENGPLLFVVGVGVLVGLILAWRRR
jgi:hypothetical protein